jgi:hypothetical protein
LLFTCAMALFAVVGCQSIANLGTRKADPLAAQGSCSLPPPSNGNGLIRLVNMANVDGNTDFCIRVSGTTDWGRPVFRDGGDAWSSTPDPLCSGGLPRSNATIPFNVPAGSIDVKAIPTGQTCAAPKTSEVDGVAVGDNVTQGAPVVSILRYGGDAAPEAMTALPEEPAGSVSAVSASYYRVVNAISDTRSIDFGRTPIPNLPTTVSPLILPQPIAPGGVEPTGTSTEGKSIDGSGYMNTLPSSFNYGASFDGDSANKALAVFTTPGTPDVATLYVAGEPGVNKYALRGLYCPDSGSIASRSGGADGGAGAVTNIGVTGFSQQDLALLQQCTPTVLPLLSVDTFNTALYGANAPYETDRRTAIQNAIAGRTSDLMCIMEVDDSSDRTPIASAGKASGQFPYAYSITTSETDNPTSAADVHPTPTTPPCSGVDISSAIACINTNCSTDPNSATDDGHLNGSTNCISKQCTAPFVPLYTSAQACFDCVIYYLTSLQPIASAQSACTGDDHAPFAFNGQTPSMILSHYPLAGTKAYILPATGFRRAVLKAQVQLEDQTVDFFCAQTTSPLLSTDLPYTGYYGSGSNQNGWENEQDLQVSEAVNWIKQESDADGLPAIVAGDWHATAACPAGSAAYCPPGGLSALSAEVPAMLDQSLGGPFTRADPSGYVRVCDYCPVPTNIYNTDPVAYEWTPTYLYNFPADATSSESLWDTGNIVPITGTPQNPPPTGGMGAIAETFPRNVQVLRPR